MSNVNAIMTSDVKIIEKIINGEVCFELSKRGLKKTINNMYLYARKPIGKVIAKIEIDQQVCTNPIDFFALNGDKLGYDLETFTNLYGAYEKIYFYHIKSVYKFDQPLTLANLNKKVAPQSIQYVDVDI